MLTSSSSRRTAKVTSESTARRLPCPYSAAVTTQSSVASAFLYFSHDLPRRPGV